MIIVDCSKVREDKLDDLKVAVNELVEFVRANEPKTIAYGVYFNEDQTQMTVLQIHPDSESAEFHMETAWPAFRKLTDLIDMFHIDIYGSPSPDLLDRMRRKAQLLGGAILVIRKVTPELLNSKNSETDSFVEEETTGKRRPQPQRILIGLASHQFCAKSSRKRLA
jgi:quinol monooxygenase YgiN